MIGTVARGTYVLVLTAMVVAWVFSLNKDVPVETEASPQTWYIHS